MYDAYLGALIAESVKRVLYANQIIIRIYVRVSRVNHVGPTAQNSKRCGLFRDVLDSILFETYSHSRFVKPTEA